MRNLTLGTIIVVVGLLAAIPFRRDAVHPESSDPNVLATGPTLAPFAIATSDPLSPPWDSEPSVVSTSNRSQSTDWPDHRAPDPPSQGFAAPSRSESFASTGPNAIPSHQPVRPRRGKQLPLTYNDLAVPLSNPHFMDQRFNAIAGSPSNPVPRQSMPPIGKAEARVHEPSRTGQEQATPQFAMTNPGNVAVSPGVREESTPAQLASSNPEPRKELPRREASRTRVDSRQQVLRPPSIDLQSRPSTSESTRTRSFRIPEVEMPAMPPAPSVMERQRHWIRQPE